MQWIDRWPQLLQAALDKEDEIPNQHPNQIGLEDSF